MGSNRTEGEKRQRRHEDPELKAQRVILGAIEDLSPLAAVRVLRYLTERLSEPKRLNLDHPFPLSQEERNRIVAALP